MFAQMLSTKDQWKGGILKILEIAKEMGNNPGWKWAKDINRPFSEKNKNKITCGP